MAAYTIIPRDATLARIDAEVKARHGERKVANAEQIAEATRIAKSKGASAANAYLAKLRGAKVSRMGVTLDLIEAGLDVMEARRKAAKAETKAQQPGQRPKKEARSAQAGS